MSHSTMWKVRSASEDSKNSTRVTLQPSTNWKSTVTKPSYVHRSTHSGEGESTTDCSESFTCTSPSMLNSTQPRVYANLAERNQDRTRKSTSNVTQQPIQSLSGHYASLGRRDQDSDYQDLTTITAGGSSMLTSNTQQNESLPSGHYAILGQRDQDGDYQDIAIHKVAVHPTTTKQTGNRKQREYINFAYIDTVESAYREPSLEIVSSTVNYHTNEEESKLHKPLKQVFSSEYANIATRGPKRTHKYHVSDTKRQGLIQGSTTNKDPNRKQILKEHHQFESHNNTGSTDVENVYDEPNLGDRELKFPNQKALSDRQTESERKCLELIQRTRKVTHITVIAVMVIVIVAIVIIPVVTAIIQQS